MQLVYLAFLVEMCTQEVLDTNEKCTSKGIDNHTRIIRARDVAQQLSTDLVGPIPSKEVKKKNILDYNFHKAQYHR